MRSAATIKKWKQSLGDTRKLTSRLTEKHQLIVCQLLAEFTGPSEVAARMKQDFGVDVNPSSLVYYNNHPQWKQIIEKYRTEYSAQLTSIPIFHKRRRLERLEEQYQSADQEDARSPKPRKEKRKELREILHAAREECRPLEEAPSQHTNISVLQFNSLDDAQLLEKKDALLRQIAKLGRSHGKESGIQADSSGGSGPGTGEVRRQATPIIDAQWCAETEQAERVSRLEEAP